MESENSKLPVPPYVAYKTLKNFLDKFSQGIPGRIDRGLMGSMSGAAQSQVTTALRYLGFISENGIPTDAMKQYVSGENEQRQAVLRNILKKSYPFVFGEEAAFDFSTATSSQLREEFESKTRASGETVGRCIAFLKDAAQDAGVVISPYITQKKARLSAPRKRRSVPPLQSYDSKAAEKVKSKEQPLSGSQSQFQHIPAQESLLLWGLFQKLPKPGSKWSTDERTQWMQTLTNVIALEYQD
jgi:hypothetical protein